MTLVDLLASWRTDTQIAPNIAAWRTFPAQPAQVVSFPTDLHPALAQTLRAQGIEALYTHQVAAWEHLRAGRHPIMVTGTASGKTLGYNLPVLQRLIQHRAARALYLFPTKALARDQADALGQLIRAAGQGLPPLTGQVIAAYDGDTPSGARSTIRQQARILLSNPDMLHAGILPHHARWAAFFQHLHFVVIDEMHTYRGVFGSHVANVLRRLKRVAHFYGATPQFILTSATIANPAELAERLIEEPVALINQDGAAKGPRHFLIYNPPIVNEAFGLRRSALQEGVRLAQQLLYQNVQSIIFGRARRTVELLLGYLREIYLPPQEEDITNPSPLIRELEGDERPIIRAYRSGYLPGQRREIEQGLRTGQVRAVVATSALELGIDIGGMDAVILVGYPGTIAASWQQAGRAGRQQDTSLAVLVTSANPLDQFLAQHPDYFFDRSPEQALINPDNLLILLQHLRCAAFELPFQIGDPFGRVDPAQVTEFLQFLQASGEVHQSGPKYFWMADQYPAQNVSLRSASPAQVRLEVNVGEQKNTTIGEVDSASAPWMVHPQAIYLHEGRSFVVEQLDLEQNVAYLRPSSGDYYTEPRRETTVELLETLRQTEAAGCIKAYGEIQVTSQVTGYQLIRWFTHERLGEGEVSLPPAELQTTGYWLALSETTVEMLRAQGLWGNDPNDYGSNWSTQRNKARARDGYRCQICGAPEAGRQHDVHHRVPFRTFTSYQEANQLLNLVTLCRSCHRRAEAAVRIHSGLAGLAATLGHLAPLFLMCDVHDVAVHADPKSSLADGQPAVLIYEMIPAGLGFSERLYDLHDELLRHAYELIVACPCADGCPSCVGPGGEEGHGGKQETLAILEVVTER